jgi:hypothetical protein
MPNLDIKVSSDLKEMFDLPACIDLSLPKPAQLKVQLPGGGTLKAFSDLSKGIPTDCALTFSLFLQIAPFLASIECLVKVLKLVQTVVDVVKSVKLPTDLISAIPKIVKAAEPVINCALSFTPAGIIPFIKDLLCLILKALHCFRTQLKSVVVILRDLENAINAAQASGNLELLGSLECAQNNANTQAQHMMASLEALGVVLDLAGDLMQIAGIAPIKLPTAGAQTDLNALNDLLKAVQGVEATLQTVTDLLGGCDQ